MRNFLLNSVLLLVRRNDLGREFHMEGAAQPNDLFPILIRCIFGTENKFEYCRRVFLISSSFRSLFKYIGFLKIIVLLVMLNILNLHIFSIRNQFKSPNFFVILIWSHLLILKINLIDDLMTLFNP